MSQSQLLRARFVASRLAAARVGSTIAALAIAIGGRAMAQDVLLDVKSPVPAAAAERGIAIGDWDGDGVADLAIGAPADSTVAHYAGAVRVHSGQDGHVLAQFFGTAADDLFGTALARMPDLDGDGIDDLAISAVGVDSGGINIGAVYLFAGRTGVLLRRIDGPASGTGFGIPIGALGDVDGDGIADLYVSNSDGEVHVDSGADGHEITTFYGATGVGFGAAVSALDDLDGDGVRDLVIGAKWDLDPSGSTTGAAYVFSTATGATLRTHYGAFGGQYLGEGTTALADLDGDGVHDYAVSARTDAQFHGGLVVVYSGATGAEFAEITSPAPSTDLGTQVVDAGDVNGDGFGDLAIDGYWFDAQSIGYAAVFLVSGKTFLHLDRIDTTGIGVVLAPPFGDLNGDGRDDLIVGSIDSSFDGEVTIYAGDDLWLNATPDEPLQKQPLGLTTREGVPGALTVLVLEDVDGAPTFQLVGGVTTFGPKGGTKLSANVPPGLAGHAVTLRAYANDAAGHVIKSATETIHFK